MLGQAALERLRLPIGELTKPQVRHLAAGIALRTAAKPDSQDVCFISRTGGREAFLGERVPLRPGRLVNADGTDVGPVDALELVTVGQRRGLGLSAKSRPERRYVLSVDLSNRTATLGDLNDLMGTTVIIGELSWTDQPLAPGTQVQAQLSAHGVPISARWETTQEDRLDGGHAMGAVVLDEPARRVAPGQAVVLYRADPAGDVVLGGGTAQ
jgi:tRNA-specific 2-thiouridylase